MQHEFALKFGQFSIRQFYGIHRAEAYTNADFHRLTPEQFDALADAFGGDKDTAPIAEIGRAFRSTNIKFGDLDVTIYADVPK